MRKNPVLLVVILLLILGGCARPPATGITSLRPATVAELNQYLLDHRADVDLFRLRGPFRVNTQKNVELPLSGSESVSADLYLSSHREKAPLVVLLHGHDNWKEDHAYQGMHVASWGTHCLVLQLPNKGPWIDNGKILARVVDLIRRRPEVLDQRVDASRIILAGHSFGGTAVVIAMSEGAVVAGGILLDPAGLGRNLPQTLGRISKPVILVGADERVSATRNREYFYRYIRRDVAEVSIKDAAHEDAQYPAELPAQFFSDNVPASEELQISFVSALTSSAFSLGVTGKVDYAWESFAGAVKAGRMFSAKKK